jgi:hypothetical protein
MAEDWKLAEMLIGVADLKKMSRNDHRESLLDCQVFDNVVFAAQQRNSW